MWYLQTKVFNPVSWKYCSNFDVLCYLHWNRIGLSPIWLKSFPFLYPLHLLSCWYSRILKPSYHQTTGFVGVVYCLAAFRQLLIVLCPHSLLKIIFQYLVVFPVCLSPFQKFGVSGLLNQWSWVDFHEFFCNL